MHDSHAMQHCPGLGACSILADFLTPILNICDACTLSLGSPSSQHSTNPEPVKLELLAMDQSVRVTLRSGQNLVYEIGAWEDFNGASFLTYSWSFCAQSRVSLLTVRSGTY